MKIFTILTLLLTLPINFSIVRYNYSYYGDVIHSAPGLSFAQYFNEQSLGVPMNSPEDMVVYDNNIYIVASGSNSLIITNDRFELQASLTEFTVSAIYHEKLMNSGVALPEGQLEYAPLTLNKPMGLDVKPTGIYIADSGNKRIIKLNHQKEVVDVFSEIDDITFNELDFEPVKITTDSTGRMYVVAKDIIEGIIELDTDGSFNRYTGVNPIQLTPLDIFNRSLMTEEQIAKLPRFLPTSFTNVTMNDANFIYATALPSSNNSENMIQLINPKGVDVLIRNGYHTPKGDIQFVQGMNKYVIDGPSTLTDIAIYKDGIYTVLDQKRSRLFTYDSEGNLLYINGEAGQQSDKFSEGVALGYLNDNLLVLDRRLRTVIVYSHTEFGAKVNQAIYHHERGEFDLAAEKWAEVLVLNTNYEVAYNGIGKFYLRNGQFEEAMEYFNFGHDKYYYSKAFKSYRNQIIKDNFAYIFLGVILVPIGLIVLKEVRKKRGKLK